MKRFLPLIGLLLVSCATTRTSSDHGTSTGKTEGEEWLFLASNSTIKRGVLQATDFVQGEADRKYRSFANRTVGGFHFGGCNRLERIYEERRYPTVLLGTEWGPLRESMKNSPVYEDRYAAEFWLGFRHRHTVAMNRMIAITMRGKAVNLVYTPFWDIDINYNLTMCLVWNVMPDGQLRIGFDGWKGMDVYIQGAHEANFFRSTGGRGFLPTRNITRAQQRVFQPITDRIPGMIENFRRSNGLPDSTVIQLKDVALKTIDGRSGLFAKIAWHY